MSNKNLQTGFTLIELLIVVLIIGILAAIAIPVFNGQRTKAKNSVAQSTLRNAFSAASSAKLTNDDKYDGVDLTKMQAEESTIRASSIPVNGAPGADAKEKEITIAGGAVATATLANVTTGGDVNGITMCTASKGDKVYCIRQTQNSTGTTSSPIFASGSSLSNVFATETVNPNGLAAGKGSW